MKVKTDLIQRTSRLPAGTVTFLFTDIEGSTELLKHLGEKYAQVLADQRRILRNAFDNWYGNEVDTQGDAFFAAFTRASDALSAVVEAQQNLSAHSWPDGVEVRVRMALHTGEAEIADEGYVGMDVHRAARICAAGHGGQVLLSPSTSALIERDLSSGLHLKDLGEHRLKDLRLPVRISQLVIPELPYDFPPLKTLSALPNNLPVQITTFIGRQQEIAQASEILERDRLLTVTGPGGVGKSRLSLQVAAEIAERFSHGVWFVSLENLITVEELAPAIAEVLHFRIDTHSSDLDAERQLLDFLSERSLLLVLDNFEHLLEGADLIKNILVKAPEVKMILSSRERLNLPGESVFPLGGMKFPQNGSNADFEDYSALSLFIERARQINPDFKLLPAEIPYATRVCRAVGGMPLGIELAAPWTGMLSCQEIAEEIEQNLDFLADTLRGLPDGHRSLRAVFDHSWHLMEGELRLAFSKLSVFRGGFDRQAANKVAEVRLDQLMDLVRKSLIQRTNEGRFNLHPMLAQFAAEKLNQDQAQYPAVHEKHSRFFISLLKEWQASQKGDDRKEEGQKEFLETSNVRVAIQWALLHWKEEEVLQVLRTTNNFFQLQGIFEAANAYQSLSRYLRENGASLEPDAPRKSLLLNTMTSHAVYLAILDDPSAEQLASDCLEILRGTNLEIELGSCLYVLGVFKENRSEYSDAIKLLDEAYALLNKNHAYTMKTSCLLWLGWAYFETGDFETAKIHFDEAYQISKQQGLGLMRPYALSKLGIWADAMGDFSQGIKYHQEALESFQHFGDQSGQGYALSRMCHSAWGLGDYMEAESYGRAGYEHFKAISHPWGIATSLCRIGFVELKLDKLAEAQHHFQQALKLSLEYSYKATAIYAMIGFASLWRCDGEFERAAEVQTFAIENNLTPELYKDIARKELEEIKSILPEDVFSSAQMRGRELQFDKLASEMLA